MHMLYNVHSLAYDQKYVYVTYLLVSSVRPDAKSFEMPCVDVFKTLGQS